MERRHGAATRGRRTYSLNAVRRSAGAALFVSWTSLLATAGAQGQVRPQLGTNTTLGRATYFAVQGTSSSVWTVSAWARRRLVDGQWDALPLDITRLVWASAGGAVRVRATTRYDLLGSPPAVAPGAEVAWLATGRLALTGSYVASVGGIDRSGVRLGFKSACLGARVRLRGLALTALAWYDARGRRFRMDLGARLLP